MRKVSNEPVTLIFVPTEETYRSVSQAHKINIPRLIAWVLRARRSIPASDGSGSINQGLQDFDLAAVKIPQVFRNFLYFYGFSAASPVMWNVCESAGPDVISRSPRTWARVDLTQTG
ncbi:hypothetical protein J6590_011964 [Homalodisca vitripennis]|nr:hypothetical protein J6590_011964 [Homalodisca vitripennis]